MVTVTQRISKIAQPTGGYINPAMMTIDHFEDGKELGEESIHPTTMGLIVDYLSRAKYSSTLEMAFKISLKGARYAGRSKITEKYLDDISVKKLDDESINNACKLVWYDQVYRQGIIPDHEYDKIADHQTCENVRIMVDRAGKFFDKYGPIIVDGAPLIGGYTKTVDKGDCDFITEDGIWDFKVSKNPPTNKDTLQVAMYYLMAKHSTMLQYPGLKRIGIFNPRLNTAYHLDMKSVPAETIKAIEDDVICF